MASSISIRESIRFLPSPPSEPTSTLVLTSPNHYFVDIRILLQPSSPSPFPGIQPLADLDWAFAGRSTSTTHRNTDGTERHHSKWTHLVDSRTLDPESVVDEGDMVTLPGGNRTLESGRMVNAETGEMQEYEEVWKDVGAVPVGEGGVECMVLVMHEDEPRMRGMVVRVGRWCQGVIRAGEGFALERWEWKGKGDEEGWKRVARMGDLWLPCGIAMETVKAKLGGEVSFREQRWTVVELGEGSEQ